MSSQAWKFPNDAIPQTSVPKESLCLAVRLCGISSWIICWEALPMLLRIKSCFSELAIGKHNKEVERAFWIMSYFDNNLCSHSLELIFTIEME